MLKKNLILLSYASLFILGLADNIRGPVFPEILKEFGLSNTQGSLFFALASGTIIPAGYLGAFFIKKLGQLAAMRFSAVLMIIGLLGIVLLPSYVLILAAAIVFGFSLGTMGVVQNVMVIEAVPSSQIQKWQSGLHSMYGLASLVAPLIVLFFHQLHPDWRWSFYFAAFLALSLFSGTFFVKDTLIHNQSAIDPDLTSPTSRPQQLYYAVLAACYIASEILVSSRIAQISREVFNFEFSDAARLTSLFFLMLFLGRFLFIFWRPRLTLKHQMQISLSVTILCILLGIFLNPLALALSGFSMAPFYPMSMTVAGQVFKKSLHRVTSLSIALSGVTVMMGQLFIGVVSDQLGIRYAILVPAVFSCVALVLITQYKKIFQAELP